MIQTSTDDMIGQAKYILQPYDRQQLWLVPILYKTNYFYLLSNDNIIAHLHTRNFKKSFRNKLVRSGTAGQPLIRRK